jgi:type I pantothenate kinase
MSEDEAKVFGRWVWETINRPNLVENIQPTRTRADLILKKGQSHFVEDVLLRRI